METGFLDSIINTRNRSCIFNVRDHGADGTPHADTLAVESALQKLVSNGGGVLYFPAGRYHLSRQVIVQQVSGFPIAVLGDAPGISVITWNCNNGGFIFRCMSGAGELECNDWPVVFANLTLLTTQPDGGRAIVISTQGRSTSPTTRLIRDVALAWVAPSAWWSVGIGTYDCAFVTIQGVDYQGAGVAVHFDGRHSPVDNHVHRLRVTGARIGIEVSGNCEGVYVSQSTLLFTERGVYWHTDGCEPLFSLTGSHISATRECIHASNLLQPLITGNLLYQHGPGHWVGIWLTGMEPTPYDLIQVAHNTIHGFSSPGLPRNGIVVTRRSGGLIQGNVIHNVDTGIWLQEGTSDLRALDNYIQHFSVCDIRDDGKNNVIRRG
jgi:hypothetical protein